MIGTGEPGIIRALKRERSSHPLLLLLLSLSAAVCRSRHCCCRPHPPGFLLISVYASLSSTVKTPPLSHLCIPFIVECRPNRTLPTTRSTLAKVIRMTTQFTEMILLQCQTLLRSMRTVSPTTASPDHAFSVTLLVMALADHSLPPSEPPHSTGLTMHRPYTHSTRLE